MPALEKNNETKTKKYGEAKKEKKDRIEMQG